MNRIFIFLIPFCFDCALSFFWLGVSHWLIKIGGCQEQLGLLTCAIYGIEIPIYLCISKLIKKFNKGKLLLFGLGMVVVWTVYLSYVHNMIYFVFIACLVTVGHAIFYPVFESIISDYSDPKKAPGDSTMFNIGWCCGSCLGAILSPIVINYFEKSLIGLKSLGYMCLIFGIFTFITVLILKYYLKNKQITQYENIELHESVSNNEIYLKGSRYILFLGSVMCNTFLFIFPIIFMKNGWDTDKTVLLSSMNFYGTSIAFIICMFTKFWRSNLKVYFISIFVLFITCILCIFFNNIYYLMCIFVCLCGFVAGVAANSCLYHSMSSPQKERNKNLAIAEGIAAISSITSGLLGFFGGYIYKLYKYNQVQQINIYFVLVGCIFVFIILCIYNKKLMKELFLLNNK